MRCSFKLIVAFSLLSVSAFAQRRVTDKIVAIIESDIITLSELEDKANPLLDTLKGLPEKEFHERYTAVLKRVLDEAISEKLIDGAIVDNRQQLNISDAEIDQAINEVQRLNDLSREQLQSAIYSQGITWSEYREQIKTQMERSRLMQMKVQSKIQFNDEELEQLCRDKTAEKKQYQTCAAHILFAPQSSTERQAIQKQAESIRQELLKGADFATYADKYSADKASKGGALGCFSSGEMVQEFEHAAAKLKPGEISSLVQTQFGFHLIKVFKRIEQGSIDCKKPQEYQRYQQEYFQKAMQSQTLIWLNELREKSHVEVFL